MQLIDIIQIDLLGNSRVAIAPAEDAMIRFKIAWKYDNPIQVKYISMMPRKL